MSRIIGTSVGNSPPSERIVVASDAKKVELTADQVSGVMGSGYRSMSICRDHSIPIRSGGNEVMPRAWVTRMRPSWLTHSTSDGRPV